MNTDTPIDGNLLRNFAKLQDELNQVAKNCNRLNDENNQLRIELEREQFTSYALVEEKKLWEKQEQELRAELEQARKELNERKS